MNALFHDPAAALVVDGRVVAAAEEERFSRRKHGKRPVPFAAWDLPEQAMRRCPARGGLRPQDLDAVAYSFDPSLALPADELGLDDPWDWLRVRFARSVRGSWRPRCLGWRRSGSASSHTTSRMPRRPRLPALRELIRACPDGGFEVRTPDLEQFAPRRAGGETDWPPPYAELAASVQARLEEVLVDLACWVHARTGDQALAFAGGTALNCVANSRIWRQTPFEQVWVQPAAGDAGTALGAALQVAATGGEACEPMDDAALGRCWATTSWPRPCALPRSRSRRRATWRLRWPRSWQPTASSPGSTAAASSVPGRLGTGRCSPTPAARPIWNGSTT